MGKVHAGKSPLDSITGQHDTQNTPDGLVVDFSRIKATSGALSASGKARVVNSRIDAEFAVDLVDGLVGVPLKISGPLALAQVQVQVQVSVPASAVAGAVIGTTVVPGIGTAIGARIGSAIGQIFGSKPAGKRP